MFRALSGTSTLFSNPKLILLVMPMTHSSFPSHNQPQLSISSTSRQSSKFTKKEVSVVEVTITSGSPNRPTKIFSELTLQLFLQDTSSRYLKRNLSGLVNFSPSTESSETKLWTTHTWLSSIKLKVLWLTKTWVFNIWSALSRNSTRKSELIRFGSSLLTILTQSPLWRSSVLIVLFRLPPHFEEESIDG